MLLEAIHKTDKKYLSKMIKIIMLGATYVATNTIAHASDDTAQNGVTTQVLPTLTVTANQLGEITENSGIYTPGAIATATRLVLKPRERLKYKF